MRTITPEGYVCHRASGPVTIDGRPIETAWKTAPWTNWFVDIEGSKRPNPRFKTRAKMLWDDTYFYFAVEMEEPLSGEPFSSTTRSSAARTTSKSSSIPIPTATSITRWSSSHECRLDLFLRWPYKDGGGGMASADHTWNVNGIRNAVWVNGTLNDPRDIDTSWSMEIAVPWAELAPFAHKPSPPKHGDVWRVNFSRVEWSFAVVTADRTTDDVKNNAYKLVTEPTCDNWVWSPQGIINMHCPEMFGYVQFSTAPPGKERCSPDPLIVGRRILLDIYYAARDFHEKNAKWPGGLKDLGLDFAGNTSLVGAPSMEPTPEGYIAHIALKLPGGGSRAMSIRQNALIREE